MSRGPVLVVGASARAAVTTLLRTGHEPFAIDRFADADTQKLAPTLRCRDWPDAVELAKNLPPMPWMYTGGLENHPQIVAQLTVGRPLLGNSPETLSAVRNPFHFGDAVRMAGGRFPESHPSSHKIDPRRRWLRKNKRSAGGHGVHFLKADVLDSGEYVQEFIAGDPVSAAFYDDGFLGVSRQLCGTDFLHAAEFHYCGSLRADSTFRDEFKRLGCLLATNFGLRGYWGLDAIATTNGVHFLECNPRYTASMELFERPGEAVLAKAIYFAPHRIVVPDSGPWDDSLARCTDIRVRHEYADIPNPGEIIEPGRPVLTFFIATGTESLALFRMRERAAELDRFFGAIP